MKTMTHPRACRPRDPGPGRVRLFAADGPPPPRKERVTFAKGASSATIKGTLKGDADVDYLVRAAAGQTLEVKLEGTNRPELLQRAASRFGQRGDVRQQHDRSAVLVRGCCRPTATTRSAST